MKLDPADFTTKIDNPYWPMSPGSRWVYREADTTGTTREGRRRGHNKTKTIANGIEARVIRDTVTENGAPVEITDDWYAQDSDGNIWYLGEDDGRVQERQGRRPRPARSRPASTAPRPGSPCRRTPSRG